MQAIPLCGTPDPHDRMCWGSDSGTPESIAGTDIIVRRLIGDILEAMVLGRTIDQTYAKVQIATPEKGTGLNDVGRRVR